MHSENAVIGERNRGVICCYGRHAVKLVGVHSSCGTYGSISIDATVCPFLLLLIPLLQTGVHVSRHGILQLQKEGCHYFCSKAPAVLLFLEPGLDCTRAGRVQMLMLVTSVGGLNIALCGSSLKDGQLQTLLAVHPVRMNNGRVSLLCMRWTVA